VRRDRPRFQVSDAARRRLLDKFCTALQTSDGDTLLALFAEDATWTADGGGKTRAASKVVQGRDHIAKLLAGLGRLLARQYPGRVAFYQVAINGDTGLLACIEGAPRWALSIETDGVRILAGYNVLNPEKLRRIVPLEQGDG
jgi:RNA polymerase sigma-70 factor (ECF subfamily)